MKPDELTNKLWSQDIYSQIFSGIIFYYLPFVCSLFFCLGLYSGVIVLYSDPLHPNRPSAAQTPPKTKKKQTTPCPMGVYCLISDYGEV